MESTMNHPSLPNVSLSSATRQGLSRAGFVAIAALVLAASAFISTGPAAAANSERAVYCLSGESENDCGFTSLAQCEATASGGLGVCNMMAAWPEEHGPYARYRSHAKSHSAAAMRP
jgi:Protein of unknown function (DUF3551)